MNRRYLATLAVAAALVLGVGAFVRGRLLRTDEPVPAAPPSEASALQQLSQAGQLRRMADYLAERAAAIAGAVEYVAGAGATGVRLAGDTVLTTRADRPAVAVRAPAGDTLRPALSVAPESAAGGWVLVVGRRADGAVVSTAGLAGGRARGACAGRPIDEYVLGVPLGDELAGAGLFDLDGRALGLVLRCGGRVAAVPMAEVRRLLADTAGPVAPGAYGLAVEALDARARAAFGVDSGVLVTAVRRGSPADVAGLQPGDVLAAADGGRLDVARVNAAHLDTAGAGDTLALTRRRGRATAAVRLAPAAPAVPDPVTGLGIDVAPPAPGVAVTSVRPGSAAAAAGLRPGDRLLRVGAVPAGTPAAAARLLAAVGTSPAFLVFERDSVVRGVFAAAPAVPSVRHGPR